MLDFKKIKQEYPKSWELLRKWTEEKIQEMKTKIVVGMLEEGEQFPFPEINDVLIESTISWQPRALFDFFDRNKLEIEIYRGWKFNVDDWERDEEYNTRNECEEQAFQLAFKVLENTINKEI